MTPEQFELAESTFSEACLLPALQRSAFLDARCAGDLLVRTEVEAMLAADEGGADSLSSVGMPQLGDLTLIDDADAEVRAQLIPERIGRYRILRECGHGGMGVVYEAEQESPSRRVALKVIRTGVLSQETLRRFQNEADVLGRLQHPGIAQIFEAGSFEVGEGGQPFFAMEYVDGEELLAYATTHALDTQARLSLFTLVCDAVHYAHQKGVIHRDLKPDNILVVRPAAALPTPLASHVETPTSSIADAVGQPKILDFGIARMTDADEQMSTMLTHAGQLVGTPQYMSPEQASQGMCKIDVRSDVYTLGVLLFQLLAGRPPYDLRKRSISDSIQIIRHEESPRMGSVDTAFKGDIEMIVSKCLEKEPEGRYASAAELAEDIRRHIGNEPIAARPPSTWYRVRKFTLRNQALVGGALATVVALVIGVIVSMVFAFRASDNAERALSNEKRALESEASALRQAYAASLAASNALVDSDPRSARKLLEAAPEALAGWELRHLNSRLQRYARTYQADAAATGPIAFVADGTQLMSALVDGRVAVWDTMSAELVRIGTGLAGSTIQRLDVPRGGPPLIACGTLEGQVRVWDLDADRWFDVSTKDERILDLKWDLTGERLLFATPSSAHLWRMGHPLRDHPIELVRGSTFPGKLGFSSDGERYTASNLALSGGEFFWWDVGTGEQVSQGSGIPLPAVRAWGLSHDSTRFAVAGGDGIRSCVLQDARTGEAQLVLRGHNDYMVFVAWTPDDTRLVTSSDDGTIRLWDTASGASLAVLSTDPQSPIAVAPDGSGVAFREGGTLRYWDFALSSSTVIQPEVSFVYHLAYSPDGTRLAASSQLSSYTTLMDPLAGRILRTIDAGAISYGVVFSRDGASLDVGQANIDVAIGALAPRPEAPIAEWLNLDRWSARFTPGAVLSADGRLLARADGGDRLKTNAVVRDLATGETVLEVEGDFWSVALSPDGTLLAAGHGDPGHVEIWSLADKRKLADLPPHGSNAYSVEFHPDGTRLATGGSDNTIRLWDTTTWEQVLELRGHTSYVKALAFSPDGTQLASGSGDLTVRIWDTVPRAERHRQALAARGR
ncbi:MAG: serine/threonine protein kinase/WD40 repeat protein [Chlamydiales bacterium]|jgi:serine/threonine protein kinase/WD40 repeat protein